MVTTEETKDPENNDEEPVANGDLTEEEKSPKGLAKSLLMEAGRLLLLKMREGKGGAAFVREARELAVQLSGDSQLTRSIAISQGMAKSKLAKAAENAPFKNGNAPQ